MKYINHFTDHTQKANSYLLQQYKDRGNIKALVSSLIKPLQSVEDTAYNLYIKNFLPVATSYHLDRLGAIIGVDRKGRDDDTYRYAINLGIISNNSGGTPEEIIAILKTIYSADKIEYLESGVAYFQVYIQGAKLPLGISKLLLELKPAGVSVPNVIYSEVSNIFRFAEKITETVSSIVSSGANRAEYNLEVQTDNSQLSELDLMYDSFKPLDNTLGFAEIIVNRPALELYDDSIYLVNNQDELEMLLAFEDYTIKGGSSFAEIITS